MIKNLFLILFLSLNLHASTYYISISASGNSDTNTSVQAQSKSTPWTHLPCMANATSNAASYIPVAGDIFILLGNDVWPNASFPCAVTWANGTSANHIVVTRDITWFSGASWNRPIFDAGNSPISGTNNFIQFSSVVNYVDFHWIELKRYSWTSSIRAHISMNGNDFTKIDNFYIHNWTAATRGVATTDSDSMVIGVFVNPPCGNCALTNSVIDNTDGDGADCITADTTCSGGGINIPSQGNIIKGMGNVFKMSSQGEWCCNYISNVNEEFQHLLHPNYIETIGAGGGGTSGIFYIHDNVIIVNGIGEGMQIGNPGETDYVWNNIWNVGVGSACGGGGCNGPDVPQTSSPTWNLYFWNNTVINWIGCLNEDSGGHGTGITNFTFSNNHCINSGGTTEGGTLLIPTGITSKQTNLGMTNTVATTQGYTNSETYIYSPTLNNNSTVGSGTNLTSLVPGGFITNDTSYACTEQTLSGVVTAVCPTRTSNTRPSSGAWDIGAYEFSSSGGQVSTPTFSPVAGTYIGTQSVAITTSTGGATICYTIDGSTPTGNGAGTCTHGTTLSNGGTVSVSVSETLMAIGTLSGDTDSAVGSAAYTITAGPTSSILLTSGAILQNGTVVH